MQEIVARILEGGFVQDNGRLEFSCSNIELALKKGEICHGSFSVRSSAGKIVKGFLTASDSRMECITKEFAGAETELFFCFHAKAMQEGEEAGGNFFVVSDAGEYTLPFVVRIERQIPKTSMGPVKNLFHFANLAKCSWQEAVALFYQPEFEKVFVGNDAHFYDCYRALSAVRGNEQNVEEFLIHINKKQAVEFLVEEKLLCWKITEEAASGQLEKGINITQSGWGYTALHIECEGDFFYTDKELLREEDFVKNRLRLPIYLDVSRCRRGKNFGKLYLYNAHTSFELPVMAEKGKNTHVAVRLSEKRLVVQLMKDYQLFRAKKISTNIWLKKTGRLVEAMVAADDKDARARLFQAQLLITEGRDNEAACLLEYAAGLIEENSADDRDGMRTVELRAYYLYLTTLLRSEEYYSRQAAARLQQLYRKNKHSWRVAWLLLYVSENYAKAPSERWALLAQQSDYGASSPVLYMEAVQLLNGNPTLLRRLERFELQVLFYGIKHELLSLQVQEQLLYLAGRIKEYSPVLERILEQMYEKRRDVRILQEICTLLIKGAKTDKKYHGWYQKGVEQQLRITNLYEYYMLSLSTEENKRLPKPVLLYFAYQNNMDYEHSAFLYHYVLMHREEYPEIYERYRPGIEHFTLEQMQKGRINTYLAGLYLHMLSAEMIDGQTAPALSRLLFAHRIKVKDGRLRRVLVYQPDNLIPAEYHIQQGSAYIALYGEGCTIVLEDAYGNRYADEKEYTTESLLHPGKYLKQLAHYAKENIALDIYLCSREKTEEEEAGDRESRYRRLAVSACVSGELKKKAALKLLEYYYDTDNGYALEEGLEKMLAAGTLSEQLSAGEKGEVLHYMVWRERYQAAFDWISRYGPEIADVKVLLRICDELIPKSMETKDDVLLATAYYVFKRGKHDALILEYLVRYYQGITGSMKIIWKSARAFDMDCYRFSERLLVQMLFSGIIVREGTEIFRYYVSQGAAEELLCAIVWQYSYAYFVREQTVEEFVFIQAGRLYLRQLELPMLCKLAFLKYYAENFKAVRKETRPLITEFLSGLLKQHIHLNFFRMYAEWDYLLGEMLDKTIVEYHASPGVQPCIRYTVFQENGAAAECITEGMQQVCSDVYMKEFVLFYGESLQYDIIEDDGYGEQAVESGILQKSDDINAAAQGSYGLINDMAISKNLQDYDTLDKLLEEYYRREYINDSLFLLT